MKKTNILAAAATKLTLAHPFFAEVFYSMTPNAAGKEDGVETAATDGRVMFVNEEWFGKLTLAEQVGVAAHELAHKIFLHMYRRGARDPMMWNFACDYAINGMLRENNFELPTPHLYDEKYKGMSAEAIYQELMKNPPPQQQKDSMESMMDLQDATEGMSKEEVEAEVEKVKQLVERAIANAKSYGKLPAGIDAGAIDAYKPAKESWYNQLHRYMQSLSSSAYNWSRLNRRTLRTHGYFSPHILDDSLGLVRVYLDTSGSCFDRAMQSNFAGHLNAILAECRPQKVLVSYFDTQCYDGEEIQPGELEFRSRPQGGGGTAFEPIFADIEESDAGIPDVTIILTDLCGSFPNYTPSYPVVWASIMDGDPPFGDVVRIEE